VLASCGRLSCQAVLPKLYAASAPSLLPESRLVWRQFTQKQHVGFDWMCGTQVVVVSNWAFDSISTCKCAMSAWLGNVLGACCCLWCNLQASSFSICTFA